MVRVADDELIDARLQGSGSGGVDVGRHEAASLLGDARSNPWQPPPAVFLGEEATHTLHVP